MKNFFNNLKGDDIFQTSKPMVLAAFLLVAIILTSLLSFRYYLLQDIVKNGIATKTVPAKNTFQVIDKQRTQLIKREVANKIRPVIVPVEESYIESDLDRVISQIEKIKDEKATIETKKKELENLLNVTDLNRKNNTVAYILYSNEATLNAAFSSSRQVLSELLNVGVFDTDVDSFASEAEISKILGTHTKKAQYPLIISLVEHSIVPNLIIDEYATEIARKKAESAVKPYLVTYKKGDIIIREGEKLTTLKKDALKQNGNNAFELNKSGVFGIFALVCLTMYSFILYTRQYEKKFYTPRYMMYIALSSIILTFVCVFISYSAIVSNYLIPFIAFTMLLAIFTNPVLSFLVSILLLAVLSVTLFFDSQLIFTFVSAILASSYLVSKISYSKRFDIIGCCFRVGLIMSAAMLFIAFFEVQTQAFSRMFDFGATNNPFIGVLNGFLSSILVVFFVPIIEKLCKIVSPYALIELADQNQELLSKMRSSAPGTFHHSLMVANLCEAAASAIGADSILARVGAFYHDIGKLQRPLFFIENQSYFGVENPHTTLTPRQSKMVITLHTKDGVEIAKKYGLPQVVIDFIVQHHGESLAGHFYNKAIEQEGAENVTEGQFRYPGPKPQTKETAILMLADALESAVRSLKKPTQEEIEAIVNKIFTERLNDGQLSDSPLTLKDIKIIAMTFNKILRGMQHDRIKYQERVMNEIQDKGKFAIQSGQDDEFEKKIIELQEKSKKKDEDV
ncbi:MAG: HDIG domain-containing protein [Candidatus Gastranaerophilales bacterium]|nr:HDIG domain-containing protein [Candidatus Gastranaerophilales bacterium]